jgi:hypothetical protein
VQQRKAKPAREYSGEPPLCQERANKHEEKARPEAFLTGKGTEEKFEPEVCSPA